MMAALPPQGRSPRSTSWPTTPGGGRKSASLAEEERDVACVNTNDEEIDIDSAGHAPEPRMAADFAATAKADAHQDFEEQGHGRDRGDVPGHVS